MIRCTFLCLGLLAGCSTATPPDSPPPTPIRFAVGEIETTANGQCFATARGPDTFQTVIQQVEVVPETRTSGGTLINPAIFRNETTQRRIPSEEVTRFETLCPPAYTSMFVASLQRALAARSNYTGEISGQMDAPTSAAVQSFQANDGLNSPLLSLATARALGLVTVSNE